MKRLKKIIPILITGIICFAVFFSQSSCNYKFNDVAIPPDLKTIKINNFENRARYVNPQLSPQLTEKLRQKFNNQTRLTQTNNENADWEITGYISEYSLSTSAISNQKEAGNRLTVTVSFTVSGQKKSTPQEYTVSRNIEFSATQSLQDVERERSEEIIRGLTDDIFNRLFSNW